MARPARFERATAWFVAVLLGFNIYMNYIENFDVNCTIL